MALNKQPLLINFSQGLDLKTDPRQVSLGKFLSLQNSIFDKGGLLQKRNGFAPQPTLPNELSTNLTTFNQNLIAVGTSLNALSPDTMQWYDKGAFQPLNLSVEAVVRSAQSQLTTDYAISNNSLACCVFVDSLGNPYYQINDSGTQQVIVNATLLPATATNPRTFALGNYLIVTFLVTVGGTTHLRYIAIPNNNPQNPGVPTDISPGTVSSLQAGYDGVVANNKLYLAWDASDGGHAVRVSFLASNLSQGGTVVIAGHSSTLMSVVADNTVSPPNIWITFWDSTDNNGFTTVYNNTLNPTPILAPTQVITTTVIHALTSFALNQINTIFYETINDYGYDSSVRSDFTSSITCTQAGTIGSPVIILRGVGIASKAFYLATTSTIYLTVVYGGAFQPTYFLIDENGNVIAHLAYSNASGYVTSQVLPQAIVDGNEVSFSYLYADQIVPVNKAQGLNNVSGIHSQTGINLASLTFNNSTLVMSEIANNLHLTGGFLWMYDRVRPVEHGFFVWPEDIEGTPSTSGGGLSNQQYFYQFTYEWTDAAGNIHRSAPSVPLEIDLTQLAGTEFTSVFDAGVTQISVSSATGLQVGQTITDVTVPTTLLPGTAIIAISGVIVTLNQPTQNISSNTSPGDTLKVVAGTPVTFTASFTANTTTQTASSTAGLHVGQVIVDTTTPTNLTPGTKITMIDGTTLTINQPAAGTSTTDTISTSDTFSVAMDIPTLRQTYKVENNPVRIVGYRWSENQQIYYQFTSVNTPILNDTTIDYVTITDTLNDAEILGNTIIYTEGGVVEDIAAPACITQTLYKTRLMLVDAEDQNLIWYSKQVIENVPVELSDLFTIYVAPTISAQGSTGTIKCLASLDDKLIIFKENAIYYMTGNGPDNTGANNDFSDPVFITSTVGSSNQQSIVFQPQGLMFQSDKGIWLLGRDLSTSYIGAPVETFNSAAVLSAVNIPGANQVRFTLDNGITLMYDYYYGQWGTFTNIPAISSTIYQNLHTYLNSFGQVFQESPGIYLDGSNPVLMSFQTNWINLAGVIGYQRAYFFYLLGTYITPHFLNVQIAYDYALSPTQTTLIMPINFNPVYGSNAPFYGEQSPYGGPSSLEQWRVFLQRQKCKALQLTITEVYDSSQGVPAGEGLTLTGINMVIGGKSGYPRLPSNQYAG